MATTLCRLSLTKKILFRLCENRRNIMTSSSLRAKSLLEGLKENPYFDKYAKKITKLQETNPEEFIARIDEKEAKEKKKIQDAKKFEKDAAAKPKLSESMQKNQAKLSDVMKIELLEDKVNRVKPWTQSWRQTQIRMYTSSNRKGVYITTPIFYVNAGPHIGHLYTATLADCMARYHAMQGHDIFFSTGTDEHGNKVRDAANMNNLTVEKYCDKISSMFREMSDNFGVEYSNFIRTTEKKHERAVQKFWTNLQDRDHIYKGKYSGWYCLSDEAFVPNSELEDVKKPDGSCQKVSTTSGNTVEWMEEENYKFKLSAFQDDLKYWLKDVSVVQPIKYHKILSAWIEEGTCLEDLSISRPISRAPWGIPVPKDNSQTVYVWLDALVNYLTSLGYPDSDYSKFWPPRIQVIGKDILKFHGVYWPAFLIAAGMEPPRTILCHSHWTVNDEKMSKSKGNVVVPSKAAEIFTPEGLRYFILREAVPHSDANYNEEKIKRILNTELADTLGNLVSRCMGKIVNPQGRVPEPKFSHIETLKSEEVKNLVESLLSLAKITEEFYGDFNLHHVVDSVMQSLRLANKMVETHKPWALVKKINEKDSESELEAVLALGLETVRIAILILHPIVPQLSSNLLDYLQVPRISRKWNNTEFLRTGRTLEASNNDKQNNVIFFKRIK